MGCHICCGDQIRLMPCDELAILGGYQIWLNKICSPQNGQAVGLQGVLRQFATGTAMADDDRSLACERCKTAGKAKIGGCKRSL